MPNHRRPVGEDIRELSLPESNRLLHGRSIEAESRQPAAGDRSIKIEPLLVLHGLHVNPQDSVATGQKAALVRAQAVGKKWDREPQTPGISAVERRHVARQRKRDAPDMNGRALRKNRWLLRAVQELDQVRLGEAALAPTTHATSREKTCIAPPPDRSLADPQE